MANTKQSASPIMNNLQRHWGWLLGLGVLFLFLGFIGLGMEVWLTVASMYFFAILLILCGISQGVDVLRHSEWKGMIWHALVAFLYLLAGCIVFYDPFLASTLITAVLAGVLIVMGVARLLMAVSLKEMSGWLWLLLAGITAIILGVLIIVQWPVSGLWVIGLFIAIEMLVTGWTYIFIALTLAWNNTPKE